MTKVLTSLIFVCLFAFKSNAQYHGGVSNGFISAVVQNVNLGLIDNLYNGGSGNGFSRDTALNVSLSFTDSLYNGGIGNGFTKDTALNVSLSLIDSLYNGGIGNGFSKDTALNISLSVVDSLYNGGMGNGFTKDTALNVPLFLMDSLYNGGIGKGEIVYTATGINLGICSDTLVWNGNENINWDNPDNWDCGTVPGITSFVIIPTGRTRYPVVFSDTEIRKLEVRTGATLTVFTNRRLTINGQ
jgi:hypothetical protein